MHRKKIWIFVLCFMTVLSAFWIGVCLDAAGSRALQVISSAEAEHLVSGLKKVSVDRNSSIYGTLTIEGLDAPYVPKDTCYYVPQSRSGEYIDGKLLWSDRTARLYLVTDSSFEKSQAIKTGQVFRLLIVTGSSYFERSILFTGLPILTLDSTEAANSLYGSGESRGAVLHVFDPMYSESGQYAVFSSGASYERRGGSTVNYEKPQYKITFLTNGHKRRSASVLGFAQSDTILISAQEYDQSRFRDVVSRTLWNALCDADPDRGNYRTPDAEYVEVFCNGAYLGLYGIHLSSPASINDFDDRDPLIKVKWVSFLEAEEIIEKRGTEYLLEQHYLNQLSGNSADLEDARSFVFAAKENGSYLERYPMNSENVLDYTLYLNAISAIDNSDFNYFLYRPFHQEGAAFSRIPWDLDRSFGRPFDEFVALDPALMRRTMILPELSWLLEDDASGTWQALSSRWKTLRATVFSNENINAIILENAEILNETGAYLREEARWANAPDAGLYIEIIAYSDQRLAYLDEVFSASTPDAFLSSAVSQDELNELNG